MHQLLYLLLLLLPAAQPATPPSPVTLHPVSAAEYARARKLTKPAKVAATFPVRASNGQFTIPTTAGPQVYRNVVIDAAAVAGGRSEDEETHYTYHGFLTPLSRHLLEVNYYETGAWWLISPKGRRLTLYGPPLYSPDQRSVAAISAGLEYDLMPNVVQLFRLQNGLLRPVWELRPTTWEPEELFWVNDHTLYLKRKKYLTNGAGAPSYWKLTVPVDL